MTNYFKLLAPRADGWTLALLALLQSIRQDTNGCLQAMFLSLQIDCNVGQTL